MRDIPDSRSRDSRNFRQIIQGFLSQPGLPFANVLSAERVERIFQKHENLFGMDQIYSTAVILWSFLGQVLRDGKEASCAAAVARIAVFQQTRGAAVPTPDTGDYCRARNKLSEPALHDLSCEIAAELEDQAEKDWLWKGRHAKIVDGFTFTMPDTSENQEVYPAPKSQKKGVSLPIARTLAIVSLATACLMELAIGPYAGKETGETALLRTLLKSFRKGDIAVMDRYYCSFLMIALLTRHGVDACTRMHQKRHVDFRRGRRLGKSDHRLVWTKPARPKWMDQVTYDSLPKTLELREIRYNVVAAGSRTKSVTIATTLLDPKQYSKADIAELYGFRWNVELDIRSIKQSLNLAHVRCKSPEMVRKELWTTILAYNLIRTTAAAAALLFNRKPRHVSFTRTCQYILASWMRLPSPFMAEDDAEGRCWQLLQQISVCEVADRPGRFEPRVMKRRRHRYPLMQESRSTLKAKMLTP